MQIKLVSNANLQTSDFNGLVGSLISTFRRTYSHSYAVLLKARGPYPPIVFEVLSYYQARLYRGSWVFVYRDECQTGCELDVFFAFWIAVSRTVNA